LERSGGGSGQKQLSAVSGRQADTSTAVPPFTDFVQFVQRWIIALALGGVKSRAALNNIAPKLPSTSIFFSTRIFLSFLVD
jgi:hypothetical protein